MLGHAETGFEARQMLLPPNYQCNGVQLISRHRHLRPTPAPRVSLIRQVRREAYSAGLLRLGTESAFCGVKHICFWSP
jgi:hypothetical protein